MEIAKLVMIGGAALIMTFLFVGIALNPQLLDAFKEPVHCGPCEYESDGICLDYDCCNNSMCEQNEICLPTHTCQELTCASHQTIANHSCVNKECVSNTDCSEEKYCNEGVCELVVCEGFVINHECSDVQCIQNSHCEDTEYCLNNTCVELECEDCQYKEGHECKDYWCCEDNDCGKGTCVEHECVNQECYDYQFLFKQRCMNYTCSFKADCDDDNEKTEDVCKNPATELSYCENNWLPITYSPGTSFTLNEKQRADDDSSYIELIEILASNALKINADYDGTGSKQQTIHTDKENIVGNEYQDKIMVVEINSVNSEKKTANLLITYDWKTITFDLGSQFTLLKEQKGVNEANKLEVTPTSIGAAGATLKAKYSGNENSFTVNVGGSYELVGTPNNMTVNLVSASDEEVVLTADYS